MNAYHVLELVGEGSFGRVYKGRRRYTGQVVALKLMPKVGRSEKELRNLKREIEILRDLQHPNIVQLFDSFETDTDVVLVTEYAEGQLFQILEDDGSLPASQVQDIACQLVSALYYLHSHRILHRDMKPQNILLGKGGVVKLCDFGFARAMSVFTMVLTSIKGTPLYMSPELVQEKPYDHTADLWALGCILYELHTGAPPFYTNSIFSLVQLIVKDAVKWPDSMSGTCAGFLKGLLTKDPEKRLSWPDLLHHPFVADGVLVLSDVNVSSPLTVTPSPDMLALKLKQVAEKTVPSSGESRLIKKIRKQADGGNKGKADGGDAATKKKGDGPGSGKASSAAPSDPTAERDLGPKRQTSGRSRPRCSRTQLRGQACDGGSQRQGQISRDYEQEFPSVEVGPRLVLRTSKDRQAPASREVGAGESDTPRTFTPAAGGQEDVDGEDLLEELGQESDPNRHREEHLDYGVVLPQIKSSILAFKDQLTAGAGQDAWRVLQPLKVLKNLILTDDPERRNRVVSETELPHLLLDLVHRSVESSHLAEDPEGVRALGQVMVVLLTFWEKHRESAKEKQRPELFISILRRDDLRPLAPLAASVLSLLTQSGAQTDVGLENVTSSLRAVLPGSSLQMFRASMPAGRGLLDGLLCLLVHSLHQLRDGSESPLDPALLLDLWSRISSSLRRRTPEAKLCSANGLHALLTSSLLVFSRDPYSCVPLFGEGRSGCVHLLGWIMSSGCRDFSSGSDAGREALVALSCQLLCFPFALDLPPHASAGILRLYDGGGVVPGLLEVIPTLPPPLLELPLSLLSRLLLCDPRRSVRHLRTASRGSFWASDGEHPTAGSLLRDLLRPNVLWDSAAELLTLLSLAARSSPGRSHPQLRLEASVLREALDHSYDPVRAAACRLLGNVDPFRLPRPARRVFSTMTRRLADPCVTVRRTACWAVGNWLGYIALAGGFRAGRTDGKPVDSLEETGAGNKSQKCPAGDEEDRGLLEEARKTAAMFASLITDGDALTRRHCCAALGNLVNVDGAVPALLREDVSCRLLRAACADSHAAVRRAAVASLCLCSRKDAIRQVLISLDASEKLQRASQLASPRCDYGRLIGQIVGDDGV